MIVILNRYLDLILPLLFHESMSKDMNKPGCTKSLPPVRNASLHLHLRETKFERGRGLAGRHRQCHVVAYRQQQGASDMIRESTGGGSQGAIVSGSGQIRAEGIMAGSDGCLVTILKPT